MFKKKFDFFLRRASRPDSYFKKAQKHTIRIRMCKFGIYKE